MSKTALLLSSFLTGHPTEVFSIQRLITGNLVNDDTIKSLIKKTCTASKEMNYLPGKPKVEYIEKDYENIINEYANKYTNKYKNQPFYLQAWSFKSVEIQSLLCPNTYLDLDKVEYFRNQIKKHSYVDVLRLCLDVHEQKFINIIENNNLTVATENQNLLCLVIGQDLKIHHKVNGSPVKISKINDRYILNDGVHRAFALLREGYTHIPAVFIDSDMELITKKHFMFSKVTLLKEIPPTIGHFLNETLISEVPLVGTMNVFKVLIDRSIITL